ncbi:MAG: hypothetical protein EHM57_04800 [Actinobacteria bacterium]|nr:MAG: hypothetical protein EHM57_04800 [Actinomycetota bacterium]
MRTVVAVTALFLAACAPGADDDVTTTTAAPTTTATTSPANGSACLSGDLPFAASGPIAAIGGDSGDATVLAGIRWEAHEGCERVVMDFFNDAGAPASTVGPAGAIAFAESGVVRITLPPEVAASAVADSVLDGSLAQRAFVVRDANGALFVDIHVATDTAVEVRAFDVASPIRLVVDLRPGSGTSLVIAEPSLADDTVVLAPAAGAALYPLRVTGYARSDLAAIRVRIYQAGAIALDRAVSTIGPPDTWHSFDVRLADGPSGPVELYVGAVDAFEEPLGGVSIALELP